MSFAAQRIDDVIESAVIATKTMGAGVDDISRAFMGAVFAHFPAKSVPTAARMGYRTLLSQEGGSVNVEQARNLYRPGNPVTAEALRKAARKFKVIGLQDGHGEWYFPVWQFAERGGVIPGLDGVLSTLADHPAYDDLTPFTFFLNPDPQLADATPLEALRSGKIEEAKLAALRTHE